MPVRLHFSNLSITDKLGGAIEESERDIYQAKYLFKIKEGRLARSGTITYRGISIRQTERRSVTFLLFFHKNKKRMSIEHIVLVRF